MLNQRYSFHHNFNVMELVIIYFPIMILKTAYDHFIRCSHTSIIFKAITINLSKYLPLYYHMYFISSDHDITILEYLLFCKQIALLMYYHFCLNNQVITNTSLEEHASFVSIYQIHFTHNNFLYFYYITNILVHVYD